MPYVITEPCSGVKDHSCVAVCPMDCIHEGTVEVDGRVFDQLFIDPNVCIDCGLCEPECPIDAIFMNDEIPDSEKDSIKANAEFYKTGHRNAS